MFTTIDGILSKYVEASSLWRTTCGQSPSLHLQIRRRGEVQMYSIGFFSHELNEA